MPDNEIRFEGHAIVTADGMIADGTGTMPPQLRSEADWQLFQRSLDAAVLVVLGRLGHDRHPNPGRRRLVLTRSVERLAADPRDPLATFWNPAGLPLPAVLDQLHILGGTVAVTGGTGVFDLFGPHYTAFSLSEVHGFALPHGTPCFSAGHPRTVLAAQGLRPLGAETIDAAAGITLTRWHKGAD